MKLTTIDTNKNLDLVITNGKNCMNLKIKMEQVMQNGREVEKVEMVYMNDGFDKMRENFLNKEVNIFPGDTLSKSGVIIDINPLGVTFHITKSQCEDYLIGQIHFINLNKLIFSC